MARISKVHVSKFKTLSLNCRCLYLHVQQKQFLFITQLQTSSQPQIWCKLYAHSAFRYCLNAHTHIHIQDTHTMHIVMWWYSLRDIFFFSLTPRPVYIMGFDTRLWNPNSLVHANSWISSATLCHLIKEELIMLSLTNIGRPYGAWRFFGSTCDAHNMQSCGRGRGNISFVMFHGPCPHFTFVCGFLSAV